MADQDKANDVLRSIPDQDPLISFENNGEGKLTLRSSASDEDDHDTISQFRSQLLALINGEIDRYKKNNNRPQAGHFGPRHADYLKELERPVPEINFAVLYIHGTRMIAARDAANAEIDDPKSEWPAFEPGEKEAIDTICTLHGPLVMASKVGRGLVSDAITYDSDPEQIKNFDKALDGLTKDMRDQGIFDERGDEAVAEIGKPVDNDANPARTRRAKLALVGSLLALTASAAVVATASMGVTGAAISAPVVWIVSIFAKKVIENDPDFKTLVDKGGQLLHVSAEKIDHATQRLIKQLSDIFNKGKKHIKALTGKVTSFAWVKKVSEYVNKPEPESEELPTSLELTRRHIKAQNILDQGRAAEAEKLFKDLIPLKEKVDGPEHRFTLATRNNHARAILDQGRAAEAEKLLKDILQLRTKVDGPEHSHTLSARHNHALATLNQGRAAEAEKLLKDLIPSREKVNGPEHSNTLATRHNHASAILDQGRAAEAEKIFKDLIPLSEKVDGPKHSGTLTTVRRYLSARLQLGKLENAPDLIARLVADQSDDPLVKGLNALFQAWHADQIGDEAAGDQFLDDAKQHLSELSEGHYARAQLDRYLQTRVPGKAGGTIIPKQVG